MSKNPIILTKKDILIDFTLHQFSVSLLSEFTQKIVQPHYNGNLNKALTELLSNSIKEEEFFLNRIRGRTNR
jgi:hypothetical protein